MSGRHPLTMSQSVNHATPIPPTAQVAPSSGGNAREATRRLLRRIQPSPRSTSTKMVLDRYIALNPSRSKNLAFGLDIARDFAVCVVVENASGRCGVRLQPDEFLSVFDEEWIKSVDRHMVTPFSQPGPSHLAAHVDFRCIVVNEGEPALKISSHDGNYCILGSITWQSLRQMSEFLKTKLSDLTQLVSSGSVHKLFKDAILAMMASAREQHITSFASENESKRFICENFPGWLAALTPPQPFNDILFEMFSRHPDILARALFDAVNDKVLSTLNSMR